MASVVAEHIPNPVRDYMYAPCMLQFQLPDPVSISLFRRQDLA